MDKSWAVKTDAAVVDVKAIGAPIGGRKPTGAPRDGDGDGICYESTTPRPCPPGVASGTRLPRGYTAAEQVMSRGRREAEIANILESRKIKTAVSSERARTNNPGRREIGRQISEEINKTVNANRRKWRNGEELPSGRIHQLITEAYKMKGLGLNEQGRIDLIDVTIKWWEDPTPGKIGYLQVDVNGLFFDSPTTGSKSSSGMFARTFRFYAGTDEVEVDHDNLSLVTPTKDVRGGQVGSDFANVSSDLYDGMNVSSIEVDSIENGSYAWAVAGYDWADEDSKEEFLNDIEERVALSGFFKGKDKPFVIDMLERARQETFDDDPRVTPYSFTLFDGAQKALYDIFWTGRIQISKVAEMPDITKSAIFAVNETKEIINVKLISRKALRRIRDLSRGPGSGMDGDGDGLTDDGTPWERPAVPRALERATEIWGRGMDEYLAKRKEEVERLFKRESKRRRATITLETIDNAINNDDETEMRRIANVLFAHEGLGKNQNVKSKVSEVYAQNLGGQYVISVEGKFVDDQGNELGYFSRDISSLANRSLNLSSPGVAHQELKLEDPSDRGLGIGLSFGLASELQYRRAGLETISLTAGLDNGVYTWARDGFDWDDAQVRQDFLSDLLRGVNASNTSGALLTDDEKKLYRAVIQQAMNEQFDDSERLRPIHFAFMPKFKKLQQAIKDDPNQGRYSLDWHGNRRVRDYSSLDPSTPRAGQITRVESREEMLDFLLDKLTKFQEESDLYEFGSEQAEALKDARDRWGIAPNEEWDWFDDFLEMNDLTEDDWNNVRDFLFNYVGTGHFVINDALRSAGKKLGEEPSPSLKRYLEMIEEEVPSYGDDTDEDARVVIKYLLPALRVMLSKPELFDSPPDSLKSLYRGQATTDDYLKNLNVGDVFADDGFTSTSMDFEEALIFAKFRKMKETGKLFDMRGGLLNRVIWEIKPSKNVPLIPGTDMEKEWILPPGTMFRIKEMRRLDEENEFGPTSISYIVLEMIDRMLDD